MKTKSQSHLEWHYKNTILANNKIRVILEHIQVLKNLQCVARVKRTENTNNIKSLASTQF